LQDSKEDVSKPEEECLADLEFADVSEESEEEEFLLKQLEIGEETVLKDVVNSSEKEVDISVLEEEKSPEPLG